MSHPQGSSGSDRRVVYAVAAMVVLYALVWLFGQQLGIDIRSPAGREGQTAPAEPHGAGAAGEAAAAEAHVKVDKHPPYGMVVPFAALLLAIAVFPLVPWTEHWWDNNLHKFYVAAVLAAVTLGYYLFFHRYAVEGHFPSHHVTLPAATGLNLPTTWTVVSNAMLNEYLPFIVLLFSLYTIAGGIRVEGDLRAHPSTNTLFLIIGAVLASFIGTTGAAMLLIRPLLETNQERKYVSHTVIFFIFMVCNCGGCLLPLGDPPLFLGYLRGVPFLWTFSLWKEWLVINGVLAGLYYLWDRFWYYPHEKPFDILRDEVRTRGLKLSGLWPNGLLLVGIILSIALLDPSQPLPGTDWHPWLYLREVVQLALVGLSLWLGSDAVRRANKFSYHAIAEVAALFFGIFLCMQPALQILNIEGPNLGLATPAHFFWFTGALSSVLDNAPTYVVFFETARSLGGEKLVPPQGGVSEPLLTAISLGAVFMGANTYIGNGPNFMVKTIAEKSGVKMPSFFGYMLYSGLILIPLFILTTLIFFRG